jgi:hypothetical protein
MPKAKFKVGQVVRVNTEWYRTKAKRGEQYQRITRVWPWTPTTTRWVPTIAGDSFGYDLLNGDAAHQKYLQPLTQKERGIQ